MIRIAAVLLGLAAVPALAPHAQLDHIVVAIRSLEEGIAQRASDVDLVYLAGYGFPPFRGGPMFYADTVGLTTVVRRMKGFGWTPAPRLARLASEGQTFNRS